MLLGVTCNVVLCSLPVCPRCTIPLLLGCLIPSSGSGADIMSNMKYTVCMCRYALIQIFCGFEHKRPNDAVWI